MFSTNAEPVQTQQPLIVNCSLNLLRLWHKQYHDHSNAGTADKLRFQLYADLQCQVPSHRPSIFNMGCKSKVQSFTKVSSQVWLVSMFLLAPAGKCSSYTIWGQIFFFHSKVAFRSKSK